jgi:dTDP-4-amino-4,6-dideoxygalactose transaminase
MEIHLFTPKFRTEECLDGIRECLEKGWTGLGFKTVEIENAWKNYVGLPHAHFLNSNTSGLHLAVKILKEKYGWEDGDEVITTPITFVSTNHAILYGDLTPVFADVDEYLCIDPRSAESRIGPRTKAIMFVGIGGNAGRYAEIVELCRKRGLKLILDAAHMAGTQLNGRHIGHDADVVIYSFQAVKNMPTADSGMICFRDIEDDTKARKLSWLGINKDTYSRTINPGAYKWRYDVEEVGYKYHGNSIMAAIALVSLKYLDDDNAYRRELANRYRMNLSGKNGVSLVPIAPDAISSTHLFQVMVDNRDEIMVKLNSQGVYPGVHYVDNTQYHMFAHAQGSCPAAARVSAQVISLPLHLNLSIADVDRVCELLVQFAE